MNVHGVNIERFGRILAKRWRRNRERAAEDLPELKSLAWYSEALRSDMRREVCRAIEARAREIFTEENT